MSGGGFKKHLKKVLKKLYNYCGTAGVFGAQMPGGPYTRRGLICVLSRKLFIYIRYAHTICFDSSLIYSEKVKLLNIG